jgi:hypothetical protein
VKRSAADPDAHALVQVRVSNPAEALTDGVQVLAGQDVTAWRTQGSVDVSGTTIALALTDDLAARLPVTKDGVWDVKLLYAPSESVIVARGVAVIENPVTRTI